MSHPIRYDGKVPGVRLPPRPFGARTVEILTELGYDRSAIARMDAQGAIRIDVPA